MGGNDTCYRRRSFTPSRGILANGKKPPSPGVEEGESARETRPTTWREEQRLQSASQAAGDSNTAGLLVSAIMHPPLPHTHTCYSCLTKYSVQWPNRSTLPLNTTWAVCVCWWSFTTKKLKWKVCLVLKINRFVRLILLKVTKYKKFVLLIFILDFRNRFKEIWREHISLICRLNEHQKSFRLLLSCLQSEKFNQL